MLRSRLVIGLALLLVYCNSLWAVTCPAGYSFYKTLTWDHTKAGGTDSTSWPGLVNATAAEWKTTANSGHIQHTATCCASSLTAPADLVFGNVSGTLYNWDVESYGPTTGAIIVWINLPTLSHTVDTVAYAFYGNASVSTYQATASSTWDASYKGVWHLPNGTTLDLHDSTVQADTGTGRNGPTATTGNIDGGIAVASGSSQDVSLSTTNSVTKNASTLSYEGWTKPTTFSDYGALFTETKNGSTNVDRFTLGFRLSGKPLAGGRSPDSQAFQEWRGNTAESAATWYHLAATVNTGTVTIYVNGVAQTLEATGTFTNTTFDNTAPGAVYIGSDGIDYFNGTLDEVRISSTARSADWFLATYNNGVAASTMVTIGAEQSCPGAATLPPSLMLLGVGR